MCSLSLCTCFVVIIWIYHLQFPSNLHSSFYLCAVCANWHECWCMDGHLWVKLYSSLSPCFCVSCQSLSHVNICMCVCACVCIGSWSPPLEARSRLLLKCSKCGVISSTALSSSTASSAMLVSFHILSLSLTFLSISFFFLFLSLEPNTDSKKQKLFKEPPSCLHTPELHCENNFLKSLLRNSLKDDHLRHYNIGNHWIDITKNVFRRSFFYSSNIKNCKSLQNMSQSSWKVSKADLGVIYLVLFLLLLFCFV